MRSLLFVPGDSPRKQEKGLEVGADALILDLEDSVALAEKPKAREVAASFLARMRDQAGRPALYVRVNALDSGLTEDDLAAVMPHAPDGIMLPKAEGGPSLAHLGARLAEEHDGLTVAVRLRQRLGLRELCLDPGTDVRRDTAEQVLGVDAEPLGEPGLEHRDTVGAGLLRG